MDVESFRDFYLIFERLKGKRTFLLPFLVSLTLSGVVRLFGLHPPNRIDSDNLYFKFYPARATECGH